jgi:Ca2+-binding RTX toxin-like protein
MAEETFSGSGGRNEGLSRGLLIWASVAPFKQGELMRAQLLVLISALTYLAIGTAATINLASGLLEAVGISKTLQLVENAEGSGGNDTLIGDEGNNSLDGWLGDDRIEGGGGDDVLDGSLGLDFLDGGHGFDMCLEAETGTTVMNCEA